MTLLDFFVALRNLCDAEIESMEPKNIEEPEEYNPETIFWIKASGQKGAYERYPAFQQKPTLTKDYNNLLADLRLHEGRMQRAGLFYWLFEDEVTIGRKPAKK